MEILEIPKQLGRVRYTINNIFGKVIQEGEAEEQISISNLDNGGMYIVKVIFEEGGKPQILKILK